jgi:IS5 family transposase
VARIVEVRIHNILKVLKQIALKVRDRLSFMRFLGLGLEDRVPDATTVWAYRPDKK